MTRSASGPITGLDLTDEEYTVVQSLVRNKYKAMNSAGNVVLRGKQKMLKMKEEFPFVDADGEPVFTVTAGGVFDVAGDYTLTDDATEEPVVVLEKHWTLFVHKWTLRDPETEAEIAQINSKHKIATFLRSLHWIFQLIPNAYEITDDGGELVGTIDGQLSIKDRYDITIDDASNVPREAVVAAAMVIDALEGN
jgi:uncharacterized protein YxjI